MRTQHVATLLLVSIVLGVGACGFDRIPAVPGSGSADPERSTIQVDRSTGVVADGSDEVTITVTARDADGNALSGHTVQLAVTGDAASNVLDQPGEQTNVSGVTKGTLRSTKAEAKQITATLDPGGMPIALTQSAVVQFVAGAATALVFVVPPADATAGVTIPVQVAVEDATANVVTTVAAPISIAFGSNTTGGMLAGTTTAAAVAGIATFTDLAIDQPGVYSLAASSTGLGAVTSDKFKIIDGPASRLFFLDPPDPETAGTSITPSLRVALEDAGGNVIMTAQNAVTIAIGSAAGSDATLTGTLTVVPAFGIATFGSLGITRAGTDYTLVASASGFARGTSAPFDVLPATPSATASTVVATPATTLTADGAAASTITVTVLDDFGNGVPGQQVTLDATGSGNTLTQPPVTSAAGVAVGTLVSIRPEVKTITASIGSIVLTQEPGVTFVVGAAADLVLSSTGHPSGTHGSTAPLVATVTDAEGNVVAGTTVSFTVTAGDGTLSTASVMSDALGSAQATFTFGTTGTDTITATAAGLAGSPLVYGAVAADLATRTDFATGAAPDSVAVGDLNGDGKPDLAIANFNGNSISVLINTTAPGATVASFSAAGSFATPASPFAATMGDINGDGKLDLLVTSNGADTVSVFINTTTTGASTANFAAKVDFATGSQPNSIAIADLNGDGRPDLAIADSGDNTMSVLLNTGAAGATTPSFAAKVVFTTGSEPFTIRAGDLNGDGKPDLAVANDLSNTVSLFRNTTAAGAATASFAAKVDLVTDSGEAMAIVDLNGDGKLDLAVGGVSIYLNATAPGATTFSFGTRVDFATGADGDSSSVGDVNGDGKPDIVTVGGGATVVGVLLNTTAPGASVPSFAAGVKFVSGPAPDGVALGDLNGDGKLDVAVVNLSASTVSAFLNTTTTGHAVAFATKVDAATGTAPDSVAFDDFNSDGLRDLAIANGSANTVSVLLSATAPGATVPSFASKVDFATGTHPASVATGDLNGDGKPDLVVANSSAGTVSVLLNTTAPGAAVPTFAAKVDIATGSAPSCVVVADLNNDGKPDLFVANTSSNTVSVFRNTTTPGATTPTFAGKSDLTAGAGPTSIAFADVNEDGKLDLAVANAGANTVSVFRNTGGLGSLAFAPKQDSATSAAPSSVVSADLNGDGKPDLAVACSSANTVSVLIDTTTPGAIAVSFAAKVDFATGTGASSLALGDLNGDGKLDLAVANTSSSTASVLLNATAPGAATPTFAAKADFATGAGPQAITVCDLNGDGQLDLSVASPSTNTVSVLLAQ